MKKKVLTMIICAVMICISACSNSDSTSKDKEIEELKEQLADMQDKLEDLENSSTEASESAKQDSFQETEPSEEKNEKSINDVEKNGDSADSLSEVETNKLMDTITDYYKRQYGANNVAAEIDNVNQNMVSIHLYDPNATNVTSNNLGFYNYNIENEVWSDGITGEEIDLNGSIDSKITAENSDGKTDETIAEYYVYVNASDGYANLRSGPGTEYEIICSVGNGEALEVYPEEATAKNGKKWLKVAYYNESEDGSGWVDGWVAKSQVN